MRCPKCREVMTLIESDGVRYRQCTGCFGCCVGEVALKRMTRMEAIKGKRASDEPPSTPAGTPSEPPADPVSASIADLAMLVAESDSKKDLRCPSCQTIMRKDRVHPMVPVQVDICPKCKTAWLDAGEMRLIQKLYAELQNSDDPQIVRLREKIARVNLQHERHRPEFDSPGSAVDDQIAAVAGTIGALIRVWVGR